MYPQPHLTISGAVWVKDLILAGLAASNAILYGTSRAVNAGEEPSSGNYYQWVNPLLKTIDPPPFGPGYVGFGSNGLPYDYTGTGGWQLHNTGSVSAVPFGYMLILDTLSKLVAWANFPGQAPIIAGGMSAVDLNLWVQGAAGLVP